MGVVVGGVVVCIATSWRKCIGGGWWLVWLWVCIGASLRMSGVARWAVVV